MNNLNDYKDMEAFSVKDANKKGYDLTVSHGGAVEIQRIDELGKFESDEEAVEAAMKDGVPVIPVEELPEGFKYRWLGWVDTPENRERIRLWASKCKMADILARALTPTESTHS